MFHTAQWNDAFDPAGEGCGALATAPRACCTQPWSFLALAHVWFVWLAAHLTACRCCCAYTRVVVPAGKRVAVIGTGASAVQVIPSIAPKAAHVDVYQRTPGWVVPRGNYK